MELPKLYATATIAEMFDVRSDTVRQWIDDGKLKATRGKGSWRVSEPDLIAFAHEYFGIDIAPSKEITDVHVD